MHLSSLTIILLFGLGSVLFSSEAESQTTFTRITDPANPVVTDVTASTYTGTAFVDIDNDGLLDLVVVDPGQTKIYQNLGSGNFTSITGTPINADNFSAIGTS